MFNTQSHTRVRSNIVQTVKQINAPLHYNASLTFPREERHDLESDIQLLFVKHVQ